VTRWRTRDLYGSAQVEDGTYYSTQNDSLARPDVRTLVLDDVAADYRAQPEEIGATCRRALRLPHPAFRLRRGERSRVPPLPLDDSAQRELHSGSRLHGGIADLQHLIRFAREQAHDVIDLAAAIPAGSASFYDDVHFNTEGALRVANVLANELIAGACGFAD
jgi:hypothetical protein